MALELLFYIEETGLDGVLDRIEIYREQALPTTTEELTSGSPFITESYGSAGDSVFEPLRQSEHTVNIVVGTTFLDTLKEIKTSGAHEWVMVHERGGSTYWQGFIVPQYFQANIIDDVQTVTLVASDRLRSLERKDFLDDATGNPYYGKEAVRETIGQLLIDTGINGGSGLNFVSEARAAPSAETGKPLDVQINRERLWEQLEDEEAIAFANKREALEFYLKTFFLSCVQYNNQWYLSQPTSHLDTVTRHLYNASGTYQSSPSWALVNLDDPLDAYLYEHGSDVFQGSGFFGESRVTYDIGSFRVGEVFNGGMEYWDESGTDPIPEGWSYSGPAGTIAKGRAVKTAGGLNRTSVQIEAVETTDDDSPDETALKNVATRWLSQDIGQFASGSTEIKLSWHHQTNLTSDDGQIGIDAPNVQGYVRIKLVGTDNIYYWQRSDVHEGSFAIISGNDAKHPNENISLLSQGQEEYINITSFPESGTLSVELSNGCRPDISFQTGDNTAHILWDGVALEKNLDEDIGSDAYTYIAVDGTVEEGEVYEDTLPFGDGPFASAKGAIWLSDGTTLAGTWERKAAATQVPHTQMMAEEVLFTQRTSRNTFTFTLPEASSKTTTAITPVEAFTFNSVRYWPVSVVVERPTGRTTVYAEELLEDTSGVTTTDAASGNGTLSFGGSGARVFTDLSGRIQNTLLRTKTTDLAATIQAGSRTTCVVTPCDGAFKDDEPFAIVDAATGETYFLTVDGDYEFGSTLNFDAYTFEHDVIVGSCVYHSQEKAYARLALLEQVFRLSIEGRAVCYIDAAVDDEVSELTVTGLATDLGPAGHDLIILHQSSVDPTPIETSQEHFAGETTLYIDHQSVTASVGDTVVSDDLFRLAQFWITPDAIQQAVERREIADVIGVISTTQTGGTTISLEDPSLEDLKDDQVIKAVHPQTGTTVILVVNGDQSAGASTITVDNFSPETVEETMTVTTSVSFQATLNRQTADEIVLRAYEQGIAQTFISQFGHRLATITSTGNSTSHTIEASEEKIDDGTKVIVLVPLGSFGSPPAGSPSDSLFVPTLTTINGDVAKSATSILFDDAINVTAQPAYVLLRDPEVLLRFQTNEASITLNATSITNFVGQYEANAAGDKRAVATINTTYNSSAQGAILITGLNETLELEETLLIWNKDNQDWYEVMVQTKLVGTGGGQTLDIKNIGGGATVTITAAVGDPILRGTMSQLRQDVQGFTFHSRYLKSSGFNGSITESTGDITTVGTGAGWALGGSGDLAAVQDANNYLYFNGTNLKLVFGGNDIIIDESGITNSTNDFVIGPSGIVLEARSATELGIEVGWHTDAANPTTLNRVGRIWADTTGNDDLEISTFNGAGFNVFSAEDIVMSATNTVDIGNGTGEIEIDDNANITIQNQAGSNIDIALNAQRDVILTGLAGTVHVDDTDFKVTNGATDVFYVDESAGDVDIVGSLTVTGIIEATDSVVVPFSTNPTTPAASKGALYIEDFASGSDHLAFESASGQFHVGHFKDESDPSWRIPIDDPGDFYDDTTPQAASSTDLYLRVQTQDGVSYLLRLWTV